MKEEMATWSVKMQRSDHDALKKLAEHKGVSMAGLLRIWIRTDLRKMQKEAGQ